MASNDWVMPTPGNIVNWTFAPGQPSVPAMVTNRGSNVISVIIFPTETNLFVRKECVRHVSDPWLKEPGHYVDPDYGVWDYTEETNLIKELATALDIIRTDKRKSYATKT